MSAFVAPLYFATAMLFAFCVQLLFTLVSIQLLAVYSCLLDFYGALTWGPPLCHRSRATVRVHLSPLKSIRAYLRPYHHNQDTGFTALCAVKNIRDGWSWAFS